MTRIYPAFFENVVLPFYDIARGTSRFKFGLVLDKTQWLSHEEIERLQTRNLRSLLKYAYDTVPYYRRVFKERRLVPGDIKSISDLVKLPVLSKVDIRKSFWDLVSRDYPRNSMILSASGGTGDQIRFFVTREQRSWEVAAEFRAYGWAGYEYGDRCLILWGSPIDVSRHTSFTKKLANRVERILLLDTYILSNNVLAHYAYLLQRFRPEIIRGYSSSVYLLAKFLSNGKVSFTKPRAVITSAETLLEHYRETIEETFCCRVFDYYGSREIGGIAAQCEEQDGYHINSENVLLEFTKGNETVTEGENGVILVTGLRNYAMPLIRYEIGDVGKPSTGICGCGRGLPMMSSIEGRISQFMSVRDKESGRIIRVSTAAPGVFSQVLMHVPIESYRIIQESLDRIVIKAVKRKEYSVTHTEFVLEHLQKYLGCNFKVDIQFVDDLPPLPSGKRSVFVSKVDAFKE